MNLLLLLLSVTVALCTALPYYNDRNMVTVPPNCPVGQVWVNGQCRDIWRLNYPDENNFQKQDYIKFGNAVIEPLNFDNMMDRNVVTVPPNCPPGQEYVNGQCRDIWRRQSILLEKMSSNSQDLQRQKRQSNIDDKIDNNPETQGIINVPNQCPTGQRPDALGFCRPILD